ncbi:hypothetical protein G6O69_21545 [Pseudenhygromyxa sp. WMMC2535]|uniref:hypothetical protein n=1 Tax=Pseudenhygromyxa sp. WMMC2535 TaxID=2712867 RepID=UPI0015533028|nr:hypothetical protein [Pseudenhygromyxa sp. WMMC2535]NVB40439.1 hypothetical protein [Pseudenhygromyxa sp. WMMC2535]
MDAHAGAPSPGAESSSAFSSTAPAPSPPAAQNPSKLMNTSRSSALLSLIGIGLASCLEPNPDYDPNYEGGELTDESADDPDTDETSSSSSDLGESEESGEDEEAGHCDNGEQDGDETGPDCGGSCSGCADGLGCGVGADCLSGVCEDMVCAAPTCSDGVANGDERDVDCGGSCRLCEHSAFQAKLDDYADIGTFTPHVAIFEDGHFAISYLNDSLDEARLRWFDDLGDALGPSVIVDEDNPFNLQAFYNDITLSASDNLDAHTVFAAHPTDLLNDNINDLMLFEREADASTPASTEMISEGSSANFFDLAWAGDTLSVTWEEDDQIRHRRRSPTQGWLSDTSSPENAQALYTGAYPALSSNGEVDILVWSRCTIENTPECALAMRRRNRAQDSWIDGSPVVLTSIDDPFDTFARVAISDSGRVGVIWSTDSTINAAIFNSSLVLEDTPWALQDGLDYPITGDIAALNDDSFAVAWSDTKNDRVHIRRYSSPQNPVVEDYGDEAPWPSATLPFWVRMDTTDEFIAVVWTAEVDGIFEVQGQVLSY